MDCWEFGAKLGYVLNIIKMNHFCSVLLYFYTLLISSFLLTISLLVPYAYVSTKSIDCILLLSFELKAILLIFSVKTLCFSLLNLYRVFNISLLFFEFFMIFFKTIIIYFFFFLDRLFYFRVELLLNSFIIFKLNFFCMT